MESAIPSVQIWVTIPGNKKFSFDVKPAVETVARLKQQVLVKMQNEAQKKLPYGIERIALRSPARILDDDGKVLAHYDVAKGSELTARVRDPAPGTSDTDVLGRLNRDLGALADDTASKLFVFIGIGSYSYENNKEAAVRQQCPNDLLNRCQKENWNLKIMLIDPGFANPSSRDLQVYDYSDLGWNSKPENTDPGEKIKVYTAQKSGPYELTTYAAAILEYEHLFESGTVGGFSLDTIAKAWANHTNRCLVSGNFYASPTLASNYVTIGNEKVLEEFKFRANPRT